VERGGRLDAERTARPVAEQSGAEQSGAEQSGTEQAGVERPGTEHIEGAVAERPGAVRR
jgi:hypothetical protein